MSVIHVWCPTKSCGPYKKPEQLCDVCLAVRTEVQNAVYAASASAQRQIDAVLQEIRDKVFK